MILIQSATNTEKVQNITVIQYLTNTEHMEANIHPPVHGMSIHQVILYLFLLIQVATFMDTSQSTGTAAKQLISPMI